MVNWYLLRKVHGGLVHIQTQPQTVRTRVQPPQTAFPSSSTGTFLPFGSRHRYHKYNPPNVPIIFIKVHTVHSKNAVVVAILTKFSFHCQSRKELFAGFHSWLAALPWCTTKYGKKYPLICYSHLSLVRTASLMQSLHPAWDHGYGQNWTTNHLWTPFPTKGGINVISKAWGNLISEKQSEATRNSSKAKLSWAIPGYAKEINWSIVS